jgi:hypothetical protein
MDIRKCIFTDQESRCKTRLLPNEIADEELYNWCNTAPVSKEYQELVKLQKLPTDLEVDANEVFHLLELARLRVKFYEKKLLQIQAKIAETRALQDKIIDKDLKQHDHVEDLKDSMDTKLTEIMEQKTKKLWE